MSQLTRYGFQDATLYTTASNSLVEIPALTTSWSDLVNAGFTAGDDVLVLIRYSHAGADTGVEFEAKIGFGSTFGGRTDVAGSIVEPDSASVERGWCLVWMDRRTLVANENIYISHRYVEPLAANSHIRDFSIIVLKLSDLKASDFLYADKTHSGSAPTTYDASGASVTIPQGGEDWLFVGQANWQINTGADTDIAYTRLEVGGVGRMEYNRPGADLLEVLPLGVFYVESGVAAGTVARVQFKNGTASTHDVDRTAIFALRLGAFTSHALNYNTTAITHSASDVPAEYAGFPTYDHDTTGGLLVFSQSIMDCTTQPPTPTDTKTVYGRIQIGGVDWPSALMFRGSVPAYRIDDRMPFTAMAVADQASGTLDIDADCTLDTGPIPSVDSDEHMLCVVTTELAAQAASVLLRRRRR